MGVGQVWEEQGHGVVKARSWPGIPSWTLECALLRTESFGQGSGPQVRPGPEQGWEGHTTGIQPQ